MYLLSKEEGDVIGPLSLNPVLLPKVNANLQI